jgi:hypothetical protein
MASEPILVSFFLLLGKKQSPDRPRVSQRLSCTHGFLRLQGRNHSGAQLASRWPSPAGAEKEAKGRATFSKRASGKTSWSLVDEKHAQ